MLLLVSVASVVLVVLIRHQPNEGIIAWMISNFNFLYTILCERITMVMEMFQTQQEKEKTTTGSVLPDSSGSKGKAQADLVVNNENQIMKQSTPFPIDTWKRNVGYLIRSNEMGTAFSCTLSAEDTIFHIACLPVAIPLHLACESVDAVIGTSMQIHHTSNDLFQSKEMKQFVSSACDIANVALQMACLPVSIPLHLACETFDFTVGVFTNIQNHVVPAVLTALCNGNSAKLDDSCDSNLSRLDNHPVTNHENTNDKGNGEYVGSGNFNSKNGASIIPSPADTTKYLLYVADLGITTPIICEVSSPTDVSALNGEDLKRDSSSSGNCDRNGVFYYSYIDLCAEFSDPVLMDTSLDRMYANALAFIQNNAFTRVFAQPQKQNHPLLPPPMNILWKPVGSTAKYLDRKSQMTVTEWTDLLTCETLIWSGNCNDRCNTYSVTTETGNYQYQLQQLDISRRKFELFLSRGIVKYSPQKFLDLLWDDSRVSEYNNFTMGRSTVFQIHNDGDNPDGDGTQNGACCRKLRRTKIIRGESRIPFTSFSAAFLSMMHVRPLTSSHSMTSDDTDDERSDKSEIDTSIAEDDAEGGYIMISRSLDCGTAGSHSCTLGGDSGKQHPQEKEMHQTVDSANKNTVNWSINIIRPVKDNPDLADLTNISQIGTSLVPNFLSHRIGMMGIADFFKNLRQAKQ